jgi:predicted nucleic acid-binding protein
MTTLVDSNVLLDLMTNDPVWADWSLAQLDAAALRGPVLITDIVYAELSVRFSRIEQLDAMLEEASVDLERTPRAALFLAAKAYQRYRAHGGTRTGVLPDLFIGAHAAVLARPLLTRDQRRFANYFPTVRLITPTST